MNLNDKMNNILEIVKTMDNDEILQLEKCILDVWLNNLGKYDVQSNTKKMEPPKWKVQREKNRSKHSK